MNPRNELSQVTNMSQSRLISTNRVLNGPEHSGQGYIGQDHIGQVNNEQPYPNQADSQDLPGQVLTFRVSSQSRPMKNVETDLTFETFT